MKPLIVISFAIVISTFALSWYLPQQTKWVAPSDAQNVKNPLVANPAILSDARTIYSTNCSPCHGNKGRGDGPAAQALSPKPADHTSALVQAETDGSLFWKITEGRSPMPSYKSILSEQQRWSLVLHIRTLAANSKKK